MLTIRVADGKVIITGHDGATFTVRSSGALEIGAPRGVRFEIPSLDGLGTAGPASSSPLSLDPPKPTVAQELEVKGDDTVLEEQHDEKLTPGLALHRYLELLLEESSHPLSTEDLEKGVETKTGYSSRSGNLRPTIRTAMVRKPGVFEQVSRTHWRLRSTADGNTSTSSHGGAHHGSTS